MNPIPYGGSQTTASTDPAGIAAISSTQSPWSTRQLMAAGPAAGPATPPATQPPTHPAAPPAPTSAPTPRAPCGATPAAPRMGAAPFQTVLAASGDLGGVHTPILPPAAEHGTCRTKPRLRPTPLEGRPAVRPLTRPHHAAPPPTAPASSTTSPTESSPRPPATPAEVSRTASRRWRSYRVSIPHRLSVGSANRAGMSRYACFVRSRSARRTESTTTYKYSTV